MMYGVHCTLDVCTELQTEYVSNIQTTSKRDEQSQITKSLAPEKHDYQIKKINFFTFPHKKHTLELSLMCVGWPAFGVFFDSGVALPLVVY